MRAATACTAAAARTRCSAVRATTSWSAARARTSSPAAPAATPSSADRAIRCRPTASASGVPEAGGRSPVVLLVDDDARIRRTVGAGLRLEGFEVVPASGGRAALAAVEQIDPAVMLLDMAMPDLDGLEVLRRLRAAGDDL